MQELDGNTKDKTALQDAMALAYTTELTVLQQELLESLLLPYKPPGDFAQ